MVSVGKIIISVGIVLLVIISLFMAWVIFLAVIDDTSKEYRGQTYRCSSSHSINYTIYTSHKIQCAEETYNIKTGKFEGD